MSRYIIKKYPGLEKIPRGGIGGGGAEKTGCIQNKGFKVFYNLTFVSVNDKF